MGGQLFAGSRSAQRRRNNESVDQNRSPHPGRFIRGLGRFLIIVGILQIVLGFIGLIAFLLTGDTEGIVVAVGSVGSGVASSLIGYGLRRLF